MQCLDNKFLQFILSFAYRWVNNIYYLKLLKLIKATYTKYKLMINSLSFQRRISSSNMQDVLSDNGDYYIEITVSEPQKIGDGMGSYLTYK